MTAAKVIEEIEDLPPDEQAKVPMAQVKKQLCELVDRVESGETVVILRHGRPAARLMPMAGRGKPWRVETPSAACSYR